MTGANNAFSTFFNSRIFVFALTVIPQDVGTTSRGGRGTKPPTLGLSAHLWQVTWDVCPPWPRLNFSISLFYVMDPRFMFMLWTLELSKTHSGIVTVIIHTVCPAFSSKRGALLFTGSLDNYSFQQVNKVGLLRPTTNEIPWHFYDISMTFPLFAQYFTSQ